MELPEAFVEGKEAEGERDRRASDVERDRRASDVELVRVRDPRYLPGLIGLWIVLAIPYYGWRVTIVNWSVWYGPALFACELFGGITTLLFLWITRKIYVPVHRETALDQVVDVLIPTYNEPLRVLKPTIVGSLEIRGVSRVFVLDDGNRPEVKRLARKLGARYCPRTTNAHAKAGNLNNGLRRSHAEFLITLDADHIPLPNLLERTLGYFDDERLAFVQTPQRFYNTESFLFQPNRRGRWSEQGMFYDTILPAKNRFNSAFFVGTSAVLRRSALDSVGGFATGTATEDIHTSLRLHARGWKSIFVPETLAYGLEAENLKEFYKQRKRWAAGSLGLLLRSPDSPMRARGLTLAQRLNYLSATLAHLQGAQRLFYFSLPVLCLVSLKSPITLAIVSALPILAGFWAMTLAITGSYARGTYHVLYTEAYGLANCAAHLAGLWGVIKIQRKFAVSRKSCGRRERTWLKSLYGLLLLIAVAAMYRSLDLLQNTGLPRDRTNVVIGSLAFSCVNAALLLSFLSFVVLYERREGRLSSTPGALTRYREICQLS